MIKIDKILYMNNKIIFLIKISYKIICYKIKKLYNN